MKKNKKIMILLEVLIIIVGVLFYLFSYEIFNQKVDNNLKDSVENKKEYIGKWEFFKDDYSFELILWKENNSIVGNYCLFTSSKINCALNDGEPDYSFKNIEEISKNKFLVYDNRIDGNVSIVDFDINTGKWKFVKIKDGEPFLIPFDITLKKVDLDN